MLASPAPQDLSSLIKPVDPLSTTAETLRAYERFSSDPTLYAIAVVDDDNHPVGLLNRFRFLEMLSRPFGRDLLTRRNVSTVMDPSPLVVDEDLPLDSLSDILVDDGTRYIFDGFIVTTRGQYAGIGTGYSLMRHLAEHKQRVLFHQANHDALTGLPNRQLLGDRLRQALAHAERNGKQLAVLYIDLDRFKSVNDSLGHAAGDQLLKGVADRLRHITRAQDTLARISGDEFAMVVTELGAPEHSEVVALKLLDALREPYELAGEEISASCSVGIAVFPRDGESELELLRSADDALYHAKQLRNTFSHYSTEMQRTKPGSLATISAVRRAIDLQHLEVHYQPLVESRTHEVLGVEALVRWRDPVHGLRSTLELIQVAEDAGLVTAMTDFVLREAMDQVLRWQGLNPPKPLRLSVNISSVQMRDRALVNGLHRHLAATGFPPSLLELEITESTAMRSDALTVSLLNEIREMGIGLSVDDFGTGYSSLSRLQRLPIDALKIDRSFVQRIRAGDQESSAIAKAIIVMGHSLRLTVTAEGVETPDQLTFLEANACDRLQGYLFSVPLSAADMTAYLATTARRALAS